MAENANRNLEILTDDIVEIKHTGLFTPHELCVLKKKYTLFQYRLNRSPKLLQDFREVIQYQKHLVQETKNRQKKDKDVKIGRLNNMLTTRIIFLYKQALRYFSHDFEFSLEYLEFLNQYPSFYNKTALHIRKMLESFSDKPAVFEKVASWFSLNKKYQEAKKVLLKGLSFHPHHQPFYLDILNLELSKKNTQLDVAIFMAYICEIISIKDLDFIIKVMFLLKPYRKLSPVVNHIIDHLILKRSNEEIAWNAIAKMELEGFYHDASEEEQAEQSIKCSIERCIERYKQGLSAVPLQKQSALWKYYLDTLIDIFEQKPEEYLDLKQDYLKNALKEAEQSGFKLESNHWDAWINISGSDEENIEEILLKATTSSPTSTYNWMLMLKFYLVKKEFTKAQTTFAKAVSLLGPDSGPIWDLYIKSQESEPDSDEVVLGLYKQAVSNPHEQVSRQFKVPYLRWTYSKKGFCGVLDVYKEIGVTQPYCKELHKEMIKIMRSDNESRTDLWDLVFQMYSNQFGREDVGIWLEWTACIWARGPECFDRDTLVGDVYKKAISNLPETRVNEFIEKFNEIC